MTYSTYLLKENEKDARERLKAFWEGSSLGRPALYVVAKNPNYKETPWNGPDLFEQEKYMNPEWHSWHSNNLLNSRIYFAEAMPAVAIHCYGSTLMTLANLAGAKYKYHDEPFWMKPINDIWERPLPSFDKEHTFVKCMERCFVKVAQTIENKGFPYALGMVDGLTTLSILRGQEKLCFDIIENPEMVIKWSNALTDIYIKFYEHFYQFKKTLGYKDTSTFYHITTEGKFDSVECDFGVMLSNEMYEKYTLPNLRRMTEYLDYSIYHLDGIGQMRFLKLLKTLPKLRAIQWNPEDWTVHPSIWLKDLKEIRNNKFSLYMFCKDVALLGRKSIAEFVEEAVYLTKELGSDGLMIELPEFDNITEAENAIKEIENACKKSKYKKGV